MKPRASEENEQRYFIEVVSKALDLLAAFENSDRDLTFTDLTKRLQIPRSSVFRLLYTLEKKGWLERTEGGRKFRKVSRNRRYRIGYGMLGSQFAYAHDVSRGLQQAAERHGVQLLIADNCFDGEVALMNARMFIRERVDFVIECQVSEAVAPVIAHLFAEAKVPTIAVDIPQPGATFFGGNSYQAGLFAGRALGEAAKNRWGGKVDKVILLEYPDAGSKTQARMTGALFGIEEILGPLVRTTVLHIDCRGTFQGSFHAMIGVLNNLPPASRILLAAINDPSAVGAVRALERLKRAEHAVVVGQNATQDARAELQKPDSCLLGSVGYFPEKYGAQIIPLALKILEGNVAPPAVYVEHALVTRENLIQYYPDDIALTDKMAQNTEPEIPSDGGTIPPALIPFG